MKINNIHCLALNYDGVGHSTDDPVYFLKSTSCLLGEGDTVPYPKYKVTNVWTEVELGIQISIECEEISEQDAYDVIGGFFVAGDITCNSIHERDHHLAFSKGRTGFCPIGNDLVQLDLRNKSLDMKTYINGELSQQGNTLSMKLNPYRSVSYISKLVKLQRDDIILTGTPLGAEDNIVNIQDTVKHTIENIGQLTYDFE